MVGLFSFFFGVFAWARKINYLKIVIEAAGSKRVYGHAKAKANVLEAELQTFAVYISWVISVHAELERLKRWDHWPIYIARVIRQLLNDESLTQKGIAQKGFGEKQHFVRNCDLENWKLP